MAKSKTSQRGRQAGAKGNLHGRAAQRARAIEARQKAEAVERRRALRTRAIFAAAIVLAVGGITAGVLVSKSGDPRVLQKVGAASGTSLPPWPAPADPTANIALANVRTAQTEAFTDHYHAHLTIKADGKDITVPANLGIIPNQAIAELHTHDATGILHVESPDKTKRFTIGQVFAEWGIKLDKTTLGGYTNGNGKTLAAFVNGKRFTGDPKDIPIKTHEEVALIFGTPEQQANPPASYDFPPNT